MSFSLPAGTLPCQGSFVLTPGTAAIPRELSLNPQQHLQEVGPSSDSQDQASATALSPRASAPALSPTGQRLGLSPSPVVFEFARNPTAAHVSTAKLGQPQRGGISSSAPIVPRIEPAAQSSSTRQTAATLAWDHQNSKAGMDPEQERGGGPARGRAVRCSPDDGLARSPQTSVEDLSQMESCLSQLEQQLVQMPRPASRGLASRPQTADAENATHGRRQTPLHMHLQQPGAAAFGAPTILHVSSDAVSFLRPGSQNSHQSSQWSGGHVDDARAADEEDQRS